MIQWPYPIPGPLPPFPGPRPAPAPQPEPGSVGSTGSVGVDSSTTVGTVGTIIPSTIPGAPSSSTPAGPAQVADWKQFLIWIAALAALWLILTAAQDAGYPEFANGMAALVLFGSLLSMGPKAVTNAKLIFQ